MTPSTDKQQAVVDLAKGTAVAGLAGATAGVTIGILRQKPVMQYAVSGGLNASLFGMTFIASREALLRYQRAKNPQFGLKDSQTLSIDMLWSSGFAGAFTGGILATLARGPKALPSGAFMFGAMGLSGQWVANRLHRMRQDRILQAAGEREGGGDKGGASLTTAAVNAVDSLADALAPSTTTPQPQHQQQEGASKLLQVLPVRGAHMDDYEVKLRTRLDNIDKEAAFLQAEQRRRQAIETEKQAKEHTV